MKTVQATSTYFVGPYLSCFYTVYSRRFSDIKIMIDKPLTKEQAKKEAKRLNEKK